MPRKVRIEKQGRYFVVVGGGRRPAGFTSRKVAEKHRRLRVAQAKRRTKRLAYNRKSSSARALYRERRSAVTIPILGGR